AATLAAIACISASIGRSSTTSHANPYAVAEPTTASDATVVGSLADAPATKPGPKTRVFLCAGAAAATGGRSVLRCSVSINQRRLRGPVGQVGPQRHLDRFEEVVGRDLSLFFFVAAAADAR